MNKQKVLDLATRMLAAGIDIHIEPTLHAMEKLHTTVVLNADMDNSIMYQKLLNGLRRNDFHQPDVNTLHTIIIENIVVGTPSKTHTGIGSLKVNVKCPEIWGKKKYLPSLEDAKTILNKQQAESKALGFSATAEEYKERVKEIREELRG